MSNRAIWNIRRRHEWLARPAKKERMGRRGRMRIGLEAAHERKRDAETPSSNKE
jgi:hypothetical protein